jgi:hypothetical protein
MQKIDWPFERLGPIEDYFPESDNDRSADAPPWPRASKNRNQHIPAGNISNEPPAESPADYGLPDDGVPVDDDQNIAPIPHKKSLVVFPLMAFENIKLDTERRGYLVKGLLVTSGLTVIWGPPKCGKSFWALDLGLHIALGWDYRGHKVQQTTVVYVALEGRHGFPARIEAFRQRHNVAEAPFYLLLTALDLSKQVDALIASIDAQLCDGPKPGVIFIDTLNRSLVGSESKDEDMAKYLAAAGKLEEKFGCLVVIVHHSGIDASRPRGHTSLSGAVESQLKVERTPTGEIVVTVELAKDFEEGTEIVSRLERVELGIDRDGDPISSCIVVPTEATAATRRVREKGLTKSQKALRAAIDEALDNVGKGIVPRTGMPEVRGVKVNDVRSEFDRRYVVAEPDPGKAARLKRVAFARALDRLSPAEFGTGAANGADWIWKIT